MIAVSPIGSHLGELVRSICRSGVSSAVIAYKMRRAGQGILPVTLFQRLASAAFCQSCRRRRRGA
ncbi:hypothetical protein ALO80_101049 [Pseudomonas caricapapayae]|uniref:Uncharacterized protein n=1 Tax=Pseudomonas caricapapayae TaxID=46678 RepID=A0A0P9KBA6_9PSED|nr:hypothetical protein ALO80_101049 [Pseudomonas caricapapayae]RMM14342.1 hypothetical protein ALQ84_100940 [Pseudomonas caricapapayae]RMV77793.1 hypothetical protein ALP05_101000 [Pseudomonas caricapapayae]